MNFGEIYEWDGEIKSSKAHVTLRRRVIGNNIESSCLMSFLHHFLSNVITYNDNFIEEVKKKDENKQGKKKSIEKQAKTITQKHRKKKYIWRLWPENWDQIPNDIGNIHRDLELKKRNILLHGSPLLYHFLSLWKKKHKTLLNSNQSFTPQQLSQTG